MKLSMLDVNLGKISGTLGRAESDLDPRVAFRDYRLGQILGVSDALRLTRPIRPSVSGLGRLASVFSFL
jgi:hypothetical protein